ncbi:hypothetical protein ACLOJK_014952, partial [Asimina triloba]
RATIIVFKQQIIQAAIIASNKGFETRPNRQIDGKRASPSSAVVRRFNAADPVLQAAQIPNPDGSISNPSRTSRSASSVRWPPPAPSIEEPSAKNPTHTQQLGSRPQIAPAEASANPPSKSSVMDFSRQHPIKPSAIEPDQRPIQIRRPPWPSAPKKPAGIKAESRLNPPTSWASDQPLVLRPASAGNGSARPPAARSHLRWR